MNQQMLNSFIDGAVLMEHAVAALFFLRFWKKSRDRFFLLFSLAFWILAANRGAIAAFAPSQTTPSEAHAMLYVVRLVAFGVLLVAIVDKNRNMLVQPRLLK
jgi:hypothetical protein